MVFLTEKGGEKLERSVSYMFLSDHQFPGVVRSSIVKDFHSITLKIEFYKILTPDKQLIDIVKKNCEEDNTNLDTLKLVSTDKVYSKSLNYNEAEIFITQLRFVLNRNIQEDMSINKLWRIDFKFNTDRKSVV